MREELEKNFLEEIKPLIDEYEKYVDQEMPYSSLIEVNKYRQYANDEEGKILQSIDEELEKLIASKMAELTQARETKAQKKQEEIYIKTQEFVDRTKKEINEKIEEKNKQMREKQEEAEKYTKEIIDIRKKVKTIELSIEQFKDDDKIYKAMNESHRDKFNELQEKSKVYYKIEDNYNIMKNELEQLEEELDTFNKTYGKIDFTKEHVIDDISRIIKEQQERDLSNEPKSRKQTINNPRIHKADDVKVASIEELEKRKSEAQKDEEEQDKEERNVFPRINPDEVDIEKPKKILTMDDLDEETIRKFEEEQMWEEYEQQKKEQEQKAKKEADKELEKYLNKEANAEAKSDREEAKFYKKLEKEKQEFNEEERKIREKKEKIFNNKEKGYEDLLKDDVPYQALKERLIRTYTLDQLKEALKGKSLVEMYELYIKQVTKELENSIISEEGLTEEEINAKIEENLDNEELITKLSVRLEILKERQKEIEEKQKEQEVSEQYNQRKEQATKFFENIEKKYGEELLPIVYLKDKQELINKYAKGENTDFKFLEYCEEQFKILDEIIAEPNVEQKEIDAYNDLQYKIQGIREKAIELGEIPAYMQEIKEKLENLYKKAAEGYEDLLPSLYYDRLKNNIKMTMVGIMGHEFIFDQSAYEKMYENINIDKSLELCRYADDELTRKGSYVKENGEIATDKEIYELRNAIQQIEKRKYIKENAYKETKIVVEPYNDRIIVYLKGEVEPREFGELAQKIKDGESLAKSEHLKTGLIRGLKRGDLAVLQVLHELEITTGQKNLVDGYTWMYARPNDIGKDNHPSLIDEIVYDFSNENAIQDKEMIKYMEKYARNAEKYEVAESIGRKKGIIEKGKNGIAGLFGKGKEKVLALGEGIKNFHPIGNAIENKRAKRYTKDREVDLAKATSTYNEWMDKMNKPYADLKARMRQNAPTEKEQAAFIEKLDNEKIFQDRSTEETVRMEHEKQSDYDIYSFYE